MSTAAARSWRSAGSPFKVAQPIADLAATLKRHGYTVGTIGNDSHINASTPEDHTPFSVTGWPNKSPYPYVHAIDIMPPPSGKGLPSLAALAARLVADRNAGLPGASWIKYVNWTNAAGHCVHESWKPGHAVASSGDRGHIHVSCRSDYTTSSAAAGYDPVARVGGATTVTATVTAAPPFRRDLVYAKGTTVMTGDDVRQWQAQMKARGWTIDVDGEYGPASAEVAQKFQHDKGLAVDGIVGPMTWRAAWAAPIT